MICRRLVSAVTVGCVLVLGLAAAVRAEDFDNPKPGAVKWKVYDYNRIQTHPARVPDKIPLGIAFDFLFTPDTALLATTHSSYNNDLLGDLTGKSLSARVGVTVTPGHGVHLLRRTGCMRASRECQVLLPDQHLGKVRGDGLLVVESRFGRSGDAENRW